jgi:hypothetical protein
LRAGGIVFLSEGKVTKVVVTLTTSESKRIIGKAVAKMEVVNRALREGAVFICTGTTNAYVAEEITGRKIDKQHYSGGIITPQGPGMTSPPKKLDPLLIRHGEISGVKWADMAKVSDQLGPKDLVIKGANAIDNQHNAAVIVGDPAGGFLNPAALRALTERGVKLVIPVGLEKTIPYSLLELKRKLGDGMVKAWKQMGTVPIYKMVFLTGQVVSEIEAFKILSNVEATPLASGGIDGAEGSVTLLLEGNDEQVKKAWDVANQVKGEPPIKADTLKLA